MKMDTGKLDIELFIRLVRSYPCIYDKTDKMYKDTQSKENAWLKIGETVRLPHDKCQKYFATLREKYVRERKKRRNMISGSGMCDKPKWAWYDDMDFLDGHIPGRRATILSTSNGNNSKTKEKENTDSYHSSDNDDYYQYSQEIEYVKVESDGEEISNFITQTPVQPVKKMKISTSSASNSVTDPLEATLLKVIADSRDSDSAFGNMVAAELANICDEGKKKHVKRKIMEILFS